MSPVDAIFREPRRLDPVLQDAIQRVRRQYQFAGRLLVGLKGDQIAWFDPKTLLEVPELKQHGRSIN